MRVLFVLGILTGCGDDPPTSKEANAQSIDAPGQSIEEPSAPDSPTPWEYDGEANPPVYDQAALEETLNAAIRDIMTVSGGPPVLGYQTLMDGADHPDAVGGCPTWSSFDGSDYWIGNCTSDAGVTFDGYVFAENYVGLSQLGAGSSMTGTTISGQANMTAPDGTRLDISGRAYDASGTIEDGAALAWMTSVVGTFIWDDEIVADTWLGGDLNPTLEATAYQYGSPGPSSIQVVSLTGGLSGLDAAWGTAYMDGILMADEVPGFWNCAYEPEGIMSARTSDGHWYQVVFDVEQGDEGYSTPAGQCDGCGTVYSAGEEVGQACVEISPLIDWEDQPW